MTDFKNREDVVEVPDINDSVKSIYVEEVSILSIPNI